MIIMFCKTIITEIRSISTGEMSWTHRSIIPYEYEKIYGLRNKVLGK
jgi:hypothetical protein